MDSTNIATIIIRDTAGEFYVHQRSPRKHTFPNLYGLGAGGHIQNDETPINAAKRELLEETGIDTQPTFLFSFPFSHDREQYIVNVYEVLSDENIIPDEKEWQWSGWLSEAEIDELVKQHKLMPDTEIFYKRYIKEKD